MHTRKKLHLLSGIFFVLAVIALVMAVVSAITEKREPIVIEPEPVIIEEPEPEIYEPAANASKITGLPCDNFEKRPFAIMYSGDASVRKYFASLSVADFVVEMAHRYTNTQPRLMGVYQCTIPRIAGPMRSGRVDHISVANSLNAVYVPWGGSSIGKNLLKKGVVDHIDCNGEVYPGGSAKACFRRQGPMSTLASASSSGEELLKQAKELEYRQEWQGEGFLHQGDAPLDQRPNAAKLSLSFEQPSDVVYDYDKETNSFLRTFRGAEDIDYETGQRHSPKNLIVIKTTKEAWLVEKDYAALGVQDPWLGVDEQHRKNDSGQYPNWQLGDPWFDTKFEGEASFYFNGQETLGKWKKEKGSGKPFKFYDNNDKEIEFVPGQIWMHVMEEHQESSFGTS